MFEFICLFLPSFISIKRNLKKEEKNILSIIIKYCEYNIVINYLVLMSYFILNSKKVMLVDRDMFTLKFGLEYIMMAVLLAFVLPIFVDFIKKNVKIQIETIKKS